MIRLITLLILSFGLSFTYAQESDSLSPKIVTEYSGYRVFLNNPKIIKEKKSYFKIELQVTNTGSKALTGNKKTQNDSLLIESENVLSLVGKGTFEDLLIDKIKNGKLKLQSGQSQKVLYKVRIPKNRRGDDDGFDVRLSRGGKKDYSRDLCPDLIVDSLVVVKKDRKSALVTFQIKNIGKGAINIIGDKKNKEDNIAVGAYFSGTQKFSTGDLLAGQIYLTGLKESKGILFPGQTMEAKIKVDRRKQSKYTRVLIIRVDSVGVVIECNEGNNYQSVLLR